MRPVHDVGSASRPLDERALSKLRWRCRRGLLENDLLIERFFVRCGTLTEGDAAGLNALMELADNDLLEVLVGRCPPMADLDRPEVRRIIASVRSSRQPSASLTGRPDPALHP